MRKLAAIVLAGLLVAVLVACGSEAPAVPDTPVPPTSIPTLAPTSPPDTPAPAATATTAAPTEAPAPTEPPQPTEEPVATAVPTQAPEPTDTPEPDPTPVPENTPTPEPTSTPTPTPEPDLPPIVVTLAPLGDNLIWVAHYDNATQNLFVYDPSGTFSPDVLPLPPGVSVDDPSAIGSLSELVTGKIYWIMAGKEQKVQLGGQELTISSGLNFLSWR